MIPHGPFFADNYIGPMYRPVPLGKTPVATVTHSKLLTFSIWTPSRLHRPMPQLSFQSKLSQGGHAPIPVLQLFQKHLMSASSPLMIITRTLIHASLLPLQQTYTSVPNNRLQYYHHRSCLGYSIFQPSSELSSSIPTRRTRTFWMANAALRVTIAI